MKVFLEMQHPCLTYWRGISREIKGTKIMKRGNNKWIERDKGKIERGENLLNTLVLLSYLIDFYALLDHFGLFFFTFYSLESEFKIQI